MPSIKEVIAKNILFYRKKNKLSQKSLAELIGVNNSAISNWENGNNSIDIETLYKVCKVLNISLDTVFGIENGLEYNFFLNDDEINHIKNYQRLDSHGKKIVNLILNAEAERIENIEQSQEELPTMYVDLSSLKASAGTGYMLFDAETTKIKILSNDTTRKADICITVDGDSMEPKYHDGDILLVRKQPSIDIGDIGIFIVDGNSFVKKQGPDRLISLNDDYDDIYPTEGYVPECFGKVLGRLKKEWIVE